MIKNTIKDWEESVSMSKGSVEAKPRPSFLLGAMVIALSCIIGIPTIAYASGSYVSMFDMKNIGFNTSNYPEYSGTDNYGNTYQRSYVFYLNSTAEYILDGKYSHFTGTFFVQNGQTSNGYSSFKVSADGQEIYSTPRITKTTKPINFNIDVSGRNDLVIEIRAIDVAVGIGDAGFYTMVPSESKPVNSSGSNIYRMYNPWSGEHLYTTDSNEADSLFNGGWNWEGTASVPKSSSTPVYRLYNPYSGEHLYTTSTTEYNSLDQRGWNAEGQKFYSSDSSGKPFYRLYNRWENGVKSHTYTSDTNERDTLVRQGWSNDGVCWNGLW